MVSARIAIAGALFLGLGAFTYSEHASARPLPPRNAPERAARVQKSFTATAAAAADNVLADLAASKVGAAKVESDNYVVEAKAAGPYATLREGAFDVEITAKGSYHINPQFPLRFKANEAPDGVSYTKPVLTREDGTFQEKNGKFKVAFSAAKAGKYTLGGVVSLSFCSEKNCVMEKVPLDVDVTVK